MKTIKWYDDKGNIKETKECYQVKRYKKFIQIYYYFDYKGVKIPGYTNIKYENLIEEN